MQRSTAKQRPFSIICLSPQEWDAPLPTNRQQIMRRAGRQGHRVLFVETGDFLGKHLLRLLRGPARGSLLAKIIRTSAVAPGVEVAKAPNVLPWGQRFRVSAAVNGRVAARVVGRRAKRLPEPRVAWLYDPRASWAIGRSGDRLALYDCVDDYAEQASGRRNRALVAAADREAASRAQLVFTTTEALRRRHLAANPLTELVGNVADYGHFARAADRTIARSDLVGLPRPVLGFAGNLLASKLDLELFEAVSTRPEVGSVLVAGPADEQLRPLLERYAAAGTVIWIGPVAYAEVPAVVAAFDVGLIPYAANDYTRNVFPLKLYEYLAAGKPVVASGLPELRGMEPEVVVAEGPEAFADAAVAAIGRCSPAEVSRRQALAAANTWETRTATLLNRVERALAEA
jgi:glycosyltransferase involved in cell wall biosynthesis